MEHHLSVRHSAKYLYAWYFIQTSECWGHDDSPHFIAETFLVCGACLYAQSSLIFTSPQEATNVIFAVKKTEPQGHMFFSK